MHQVAVAYKPTGTTGPARRQIVRTLPSRWQDITPEQVWRCMDMVIRGVPRTAIVDYLLQLPDFIGTRLSREEMYDLIRCITWMEVDTQSPAPIAPYIDTDSGERLYLPTDRFASVTCLEYVLLDEMYTAYMADQDPAMEHGIVALVLRPAGSSADPSADPRIQLLSTEQTAMWIDVVRSLPESIIVYIITLISANRAYVHRQYAHWLFSDTPVSTREEGEDQGEIDTEEFGLNFGWWGAYMDVASDGIFGTYDQVLHTPFHTVCMHMVRKVEAARLHRQEADHARARANA